MSNSPYRSSLYRTARRSLLCWMLVLVSAGTLLGQFARKATASQGPRALGLLIMRSKGQPRLLPIAIMIDGHFYDAGAYKANPVPMALEQGTVYEAERSGNSLGLFTVNQVLQQKNNFIAEGSYHANGEKVASTSHKAENKPREDKDEGPPVLRRSGVEPSNPSTAPAESKPSGTPAEAKRATPPAESKSSNSPPASETTSAKATPPKPEPEPEDPNVPKLRRGATERKDVPEDRSIPAAPAKKSSTDKSGSGLSSSVAHNPDTQEIPAISDAGGPEPRPYGYDMKPDEEQAFRTKMLAMVTEELRKQFKEFATPAAAPSSHRPGSARTKTFLTDPQPTFEDVQLRVFDVSSSNEPVVILTATDHPPVREAGTTAADYYVTVVARSDIYDELRKLFSQVTNASHLDVAPRMQLIDAVDADGDGRAELLFRQTSEAGTAYDIYRVSSDRLWPLFEGTPQ